MSKYEWRVRYKRRHCAPKVKLYQTEEAARRRMGLLSSDEPWLYYREPTDPDALVCCDGRECGCQAITVREQSAETRKGMPPLLSAVLECREVGEWRCPTTRRDP